MDAKEALAKFQAEAGDVQERTIQFRPSIRLQGTQESPNQAGTFVAGTVLGKRELTSPEGNVSLVLTLRVDSTNVTPTRKEGKGDEARYIPVPFTPGMEADLMGTAQLTRLAKDTPIGAKVFVEFLGKKKIKTRRGAVTANQFRLLESTAAVAATADEEVY
jgi:hypothetical protein